MGAFRVPYAFAWGKYGNFANRTDNLIASTDATPDISGGNLFWTNNASATSITYFDGATNGLVNPEEGQQIMVGCLDAVTTFVDGAQFRTRNGRTPLAPPGSFFHFVYHNSTWYETYRSANTAGFIQAESSNLAGTGILAINPYVSGVTLLTGASSSMTLRGMTGGENSQRVTFTVVGSSVTIITNSAGATDSFVVRSVGGTSAIITGSGSITFVRALQGTTAKWFELVPISSTSG